MKAPIERSFGVELNIFDSHWLIYFFLKKRFRIDIGVYIFTVLWKKMKKQSLSITVEKYNSNLFMK